MTKSKNHKLVYFSFFLIALFWVSSCDSYTKEDYFKEYYQFITRVESEYKQYDEIKWNEVDLEFNKLNNELYYKIYAELDNTDQQQIGKLKAKYKKIKYFYEINNVTIQDIKDGIQETVGVIQEVLETTKTN